jgi:predicted pyridoxine 5'-phosphate oxidase superfamily flavin-nucleotide-binding protein
MSMVSPMDSLTPRDRLLRHIGKIFGHQSRITRNRTAKSNATMADSLSSSPARRISNLRTSDAPLGVSRQKEPLP